MITAKGLEGVIVDDSAICKIDGNTGRLIYRGYDIHDLASSLSFEEVAYLLWNGDLPNRDQLKEFNTRLAHQRTIPESLQSAIRKLPASSNALDVFRTAISVLGTEMPLKRPDMDDAIAISAKIPTINAAFDRIRHGQEPVEPREDLSHSANYLYMLTGRPAEPVKVDALNKYLILLADHGMNSSTFTARVVASTWSDAYSAVVAAVCALKGPLHGGAPAPVLKTLQDIGTPERADGWIRNELKSDRRLMGFGHRVYRTTDPRAQILKEIAEKSAEKNIIELAKVVEATAIRILQEYRPEHKLYANVEFYSAVVMHSVGLSADLFTATFAASRSVGWTANILEQVANNRLIRPTTQYTGPLNRKVVPISAR
jgi:citrate synthase